MGLKIRLTDAAARDLEELYDFLAENDSESAANHVLDNIEKVFDGLKGLPNPGSHPKELLSLGIKEYREIFFKPYRIIYRVFEDAVYVYLIADGRRDMKSLMARRLFGA